MSNLVVIRYVKLNNILSHVQTSIEFPLGLTALVGPNGAGKSSIIDSIVYALFMNPQNIRGFRGSSKKSFLRTGASSGSIEVGLSVGGKRYVVYRSISIAKGDEAVLYEVQEDGKRKVLASGVQPVLDYVRRILSIPSPESVRYTVISRQNEISRILEEIPSARKELILKLLGLEELEKAKELLKEYLEQVNRDRDLFEKLRADLNEVRRRVQELQKVIDRDQLELSRLEAEVEDLRRAVDRYEKALELLRSYEKVLKAKDIASELRALENVLDVCRRVQAIDVEGYISLLSSLMDRKRGLEDAKKKLSEVYSELKAVLDGIHRDLGLEVEYEDTTRVLEEVQSFIENLEPKRGIKQAELSIVKNSVDIIKNSAVCPLCGRELDSDLRARLLKDMDMKVSSLSEEIKRIDSLLAKAKWYVEKLKKLDRIKTEVQAEIDTYRRHIAELLQKLKEMKNAIDPVVDQVKRYNVFAKCFQGNDSYNVETLKCVRISAIGVLKSYEEKKAMLEKLLGEGVSIDSVEELYRDIREQLAGLSFNADSISVEALESMYRDVMRKLNSAKENLGKVRGRLESTMKMLQMFEEKEREIISKLENLKRNVDLYPILDILVNKVLGKDGILAKMLTVRVRKLMEKYTNIVLRELGMEFRVVIGEDYDIGVRSSLGDIDVRSLSGGEMVALAIALRIALAYTVFGRLPGFFILDEPTQFLDVERRRAVFEIIKRLSERVPQVIVVTHDQEVIELADKVFHVSKEGGRSVVKEGEKIAETILNT